jgi:hypothetical protein
MQKYQTSMFKNIEAADSNLKSGKINRSQFNTLLGIILKKEVNDFVQLQVKSFAPKQENNSFTFVQYAHKRHLKQNV